MKHDDARYKRVLPPSEVAPADSIQIACQTFRRQIGTIEWQKFSRGLGYVWGQKPSLSMDKAVSYGRGRQDGIPCVFASKAGKHYVFTFDGKIAAKPLETKS